ncbi:hypothetical protein [uncultured Thiodictyon sp.]|uniref:hypothetical protein n=1 Tax=uncultured Thiodictyon sp. TaxID=1846217 RepID=UPI0025D53D31|nr:hypothetical protein [uncultured Thiodictyon sp.]
MSRGIDFPSLDWGIAAGISGSAGEIIDVNIMLFYLLNVRSQVIYPGRFISASLGAGAGVRGASLSNPSWTFFRTSKPLMTEDFAGFATMATGEMTALLGGALSYLTFWGVDHDPYWLDLGGVTVGLSAGASITILGSVHFFDDPRRVIGSPITAGT